MTGIFFAIKKESFASGDALFRLFREFALLYMTRREKVLKNF